MISLGAGVGIGLIALSVTATTAYQTGYKIAEHKYLKKEVAVVTEEVKQEKKAQESDQVVVEQRQEKAQIVTRIVTKVRREIVKLPVRDCGFTPDERLSINAAYCISLPDAASCLLDTVPNGGGATGSRE